MCKLPCASPEKQEYVISSKAKQSLHVRLTRLLRASPRTGPCISSINNPVHSFGLKCYKQIALIGNNINDIREKESINAHNTFICRIPVEQTLASARVLACKQHFDLRIHQEMFSVVF